MRKTWNVRDQTEEALATLLEKKYKEIDREFKKLRKVANIEDAKKPLETICQLRNLTNEIELELMRREYNNGTTS